jgi:hypothetical protein
MTELHAGLKLFRDELRDAVARDLASPRRPRPRARGALVPVLSAAAAAGVLVVTQTGAPAVPTVDAAIMRHVTAALTPPAATILHERALVTRGSTTQPYELWTETGPPFHYRVIKWGHEGAGVGSEPTDPAAALRSLVASGKAHVAASTTIAGVAAYKLTVAGAPRFLNGTAYVSRADYRPLEIDTTDGGGERIVFQSYEHLPANSSNLALLK